MKLPLTDRVAVVTGASSGIGAATAKATVVATGHNVRQVEVGDRITLVNDEGGQPVELVSAGKDVLFTVDFGTNGAAAGLEGRMLGHGDRKE